MYLSMITETVEKQVKRHNGVLCCFYSLLEYSTPHDYYSIKVNGSPHQLK